MIKYHLEIYAPGSSTDCWVEFQASSPFMTVSVGDIIEPRNWNGRDFDFQTNVLQVTQVRHFIYKNQSGVTHLVRVFTEEVRNDLDISTP